MFPNLKHGIIRSGLYCLIFLSIHSMVAAHGFGKQVVAEELAGPYTVSVWIEPTTPTTHDPTHITVSVSYEAEIIQNAEVNLRAHHPTEDSVLNISATHENAVNKLSYEAEADFSDKGEWRIEVEIDGEQGNGNLEFNVMVTDEKKLPIEWLVSGGILAIIVIGGGVYEFHKHAQSKEQVA